MESDWISDKLARIVIPRCNNIRQRNKFDISGSVRLEWLKKVLTMLLYWSSANKTTYIISSDDNVVLFSDSFSLTLIFWCFTFVYLSSMFLMVFFNVPNACNPVSHPNRPISEHSEAVHKSLPNGLNTNLGFSSLTQGLQMDSWAFCSGDVNKQIKILFKCLHSPFIRILLDF